MKKILFLLLLPLVPLTTLANTEIVQLLVFRLNPINHELELESSGSGTAIDNDIILTNKHIFLDKSTGENINHLTIICYRKGQKDNISRCSTKAGVTAFHHKYDVALVRPLPDENFFLPAVKVSLAKIEKHDTVRVIGFPKSSKIVSNFGDTKTLESVSLWIKGEIDKIKGNKPTISRGKVIKKVKIRGKEGKLLYTDAKVNFGSSGGAAFDEFGHFIGVPTFMDKEGNSFILEYKQFHDWVKENKHIDPIYSLEAVVSFDQKENENRFFASASKPKVKKSIKVKERLVAKVQEKPVPEAPKVKKSIKAQEQLIAKVQEKPVPEAPKVKQSIQVKEQLIAKVQEKPTLEVSKAKEPVKVRGRIIAKAKKDLLSERLKEKKLLKAKETLIAKMGESSEFQKSEKEKLLALKDRILAKANQFSLAKELEYKKLMKFIEVPLAKRDASSTFVSQLDQKTKEDIDSQISESEKEEDNKRKRELLKDRLRVLRRLKKSLQNSLTA